MKNEVLYHITYQFSRALALIPLHLVLYILSLIQSIKEKRCVYLL